MRRSLLRSTKIIHSVLGMLTLCSASAFGQLSTRVPYQVYDFKSTFEKAQMDETFSHYSVTPAEVYAIKLYGSTTAHAFADINQYLRLYPSLYVVNEAPPEVAKKYVDQIDNVFKKMPLLPSNIILFRGMTLGWRENKPFKVGEEFADKAYVSTSLSIKIADLFWSKQLGKPEIKSRGATFALYFEGQPKPAILIDKNNEEEAILPHGQHFKVMQQLLDYENEYDLVQICPDQGCAEFPNLEILSWWNTELSRFPK